MANDKQADGQLDGGYENCFVAYLDILGFKSKVLESEGNRNTFARIKQSLNIVNVIPTDGTKISHDSSGQRPIALHSRSFSDSLLFFLKEKPEDIAHLFFVIRYLQDLLWQREICLRGSIVQGQMYWAEPDDDLTFGQGLIDAHQCETKIAIFPRIVVSGGLYKYIIEKSPRHILLQPTGMRVWRHSFVKTRTASTSSTCSILRSPAFKANV